MNDRTLLELAARAAGIDPVLAEPINFSTGVEYYWNPRDDDGDALRLAVKLRLDISVEREIQVSWWQGESLETVTWPLGDDPYAAARYAIVRAAAEIGKSMTQPGATSSP
ncbi:hypothetical protein ACM8AB_31530 [Pseudomonas aeruginosa]|uniref:hypothetical protein n=1 Tax=Pseudomonas aeruginosa TaxID=287 RepID=UPI0021E7EF46|nr:hypothetical protein [Pseudomonas aeruginosa]MCV3907850.1 hypothetical protein [Pseudomonas aeruginosa]MDP5582394.1 hypothetical protein [Pseudomonas aeruginosa]HCF9490649.1 hypothetical protein [Pseudomonas aeruginosa]